MNWVTKYLKSGGTMLLRAVGVEATRRCAVCIVDTVHDKYVCKSNNGYYFCSRCGNHN